jgi:DNA polymerase IV
VTAIALPDEIRWLYLDMNSFFASVEQELNPALRGKPVAVVPLLADTTSVIAASYEAKARGVKTGTRVGEAKRLCPSIHLIEANHEHYIRYHHQIVEAVESCLPVDSVCSIDEIACRLTGSQRNVEAARLLAREIKKTLRERVGVALLCSIGVAPNRYLAKIAADMQKPDGFTAIRKSDLPNILHQLTLRDLPGIGEKTEERLHRQGIFNLKTICSLSPAAMKQAWGSIVGEELHRLLRGEELPEKGTEQKSIGHSHVLPPDLRHEAGALTVLKKLTTKTALRLRKEKYWATRIEVFVRYLREDAWKASATIPETQDTFVFLQAVRDFWKQVPSGSPFAVGITFSNLIPDSKHVPSLFDDLKREELTHTLDRLNERFGRDMIHFGAAHVAKNAQEIAPLRIAFTRIPDLSEV